MQGNISESHLQDAIDYCSVCKWYGTIIILFLHWAAPTIQRFCFPHFSNSTFPFANQNFHGTKANTDDCLWGSLLESLSVRLIWKSTYIIYVALHSCTLGVVNKLQGFSSYSISNSVPLIGLAFPLSPQKIQLFGCCAT